MNIIQLLNTKMEAYNWIVFVYKKIQNFDQFRP